MSLAVVRAVASVSRTVYCPLGSPATEKSRALTPPFHPLGFTYHPTTVDTEEFDEELTGAGRPEPELYAVGGGVGVHPYAGVGG